MAPRNRKKNRVGRGEGAAPQESVAWLLSGLLLALALPGGEHPVAPVCRGAEAWLFEDSGERIAARTCASSLRPPRVEGRWAEGILFGEPLDPNLASVRSLEALPGIGVRRAEALVRTREKARFAQIGDLVRARGIGPRTLERVRPFVRVNDTPPDRGQGGGL